MLSITSRAAGQHSRRSAKTHSYLAPRALLAGGLALALVACAGSSSSGGNGGSSNGGSSGSGGSSTSAGGSGGGSTAKGGSGGGNGGANGGSGGGNGGASGGSGGGSTAKGGSGGGNGGSSSGGSSAGGSSAGGSSAGGSTAGAGGGTSPGGAGGGTSPGGAGGGTSPGGAGGGSGNRPKGYFYTADWSVSKVDWHGCVWASKDNDVSGSTTTITPQDFMSTADGGPYHLTGTIHNAYEAVALLGFNINESISGSADQCKYDPAVKDGPPTATIPSGATGIAVNWSAAKLPADFRIQIQGVKGGSDATNRWCAGIKDASGPSFIPFTDFNTSCWKPADGKAYNNEPIDAVAFLVPGTTSEKKAFDITIGGFAPGTSKSDAPGPVAACGTKTGTVGTTSVNSDTTKAKEASLERVATQGKDCKKYIVNNNNWGSPTSSFQQLSFTGTSFKVSAMNGSGSSAPASFPSLFIGANGQIGTGGVFSTWEDSGLPKQISAIQSAQTTFKWSGKSSGDFNAAYDIWFAKSPPTAGGYDDGVSGLLMIWLYKPGSRQPIGDAGNLRSATIGGQQFDVWRGKRAATAKGTDDANRPVVSYVAKSTITNFTANLKDFFDDAVKNGDADKNAGSTSQAFSASWYLTDVFGGFEIWSGGEGLSMDEFSAVIK
jgi:hypothetical protein